MRQPRLSLLLTILCTTAAQAVQFGPTRRVVLSPSNSDSPSVSLDERYVGFASSMRRTPYRRHFQYFLTDRTTRRTSIVSMSTHGRVGNGDSGGGTLSADGRYAAFLSTASNLVRHDHNRTYDVFVRDRVEHKTTRVSVASDGAESHPASIVGTPIISADGRFVAFFSDAPDLPNDTNRTGDVFLHDRQTGTTTRVSVATDGTEGNGSCDPGSVAMSSDARFIAFYSRATNLVPPGPGYCGPGTFLRDQLMQTTICVANDGVATALSGDGRFLAYLTYPAGNVFVYDAQTGTKTRGDVGPPGMPLVAGIADIPEISADGHYVVFTSYYGEISAASFAVFLRDLVAGTTEPVSVGPGNVLRPAEEPAISADGGVIVFASDFRGLAAGPRASVDSSEVYERAAER
jgi:Tol biopolymer transport system component